MLWRYPVTTTSLTESLVLAWASCAMAGDAAAESRPAPIAVVVSQYHLNICSAP